MSELSQGEIDRIVNGVECLVHIATELQEIKDILADIADKLTIGYVIEECDEEETTCNS